MMQKLLIFLCFFTFASHDIFSQTQTIRTLKQRISDSKTSDERLDAILLLCEERHSLSNDTLLRYATEAKQLAQHTGRSVKLALAESYLAAYLIKNGQLDSALNMIDKDLKQVQNLDDTYYVTSRLLSAKAQVFIRTNRYKEAIGEFFKLLDIAEQHHDTLGVMVAKNGVGWAHMEMDQNVEALKWFYDALNVTTNEFYYSKYSSVLSNIAATYNTLNKNDSAAYYINRAVYYARQGDNLSFLANALNIQADIFIDDKNYTAAELSLNEALEIRKQIGDPFYIVSDMSQLAIFYANNNQPAKGIQLSLEAISLARKYGLSTKLPLLYQALALSYKATGDLAKYGETLEKVIDLKDSVFRINSAEALAEMQAKYNAQKQENIIIQQEFDLERKNYILTGSLLLLLSGVIISWLLFKNYRRKQKDLQEKIRKEEKRMSMQAVVEAEENERKRIAADLHDNMGAYATAIIANVDDVIEKGNASEPLLQSLKLNAAEIMSTLRETIWALNKEKIALTGICDRFKSYVKKISPSYSAVNVEIFENIENDIQFSPVNALNVFRILQEAVTNALKHSGANEVKVSFVSNGTMHLTIADNGKGINESAEGIRGNGMINMRSRAAESGLEIEIKPASEKGTLVHIYTKQ